MTATAPAASPQCLIHLLLLALGQTGALRPAKLHLLRCLSPAGIQQE